MATTLADLQTRALLRADMPTNTTRYASGELTDYINDSLAELYDTLVAIEGFDRFLDGYEFLTYPSQTRYGLPNDFFKAAGLDFKSSGTYYTLLQFNHSDRLLYQNSTEYFSGSVPRHRYRIIKNTIDIFPAPQDAYNCTLHYIPQVTKLSDSTDEVDVTILEGWLEYVVIDVAIKLLEKDEEIERASLLRSSKGTLLQRIQASSGRDLETPEVVTDSGETLFNLRIEARYKANMLEQGSRGSSVVSDRELTSYINRSIEELYDLIIKAYDANYFLSSHSFSTVANTREYDLPSDFYKMGGVDITVSGEVYAMSNFNIAERNYYETSTTAGRLDTPLMHYNIQGDKIRILPAPDSVYAMTLWYTKLPAKLTNDSDTIEDTIIRSWMEYVTTDAAIKMLGKALLGMSAAKAGGIQSSLQMLMTHKAALRARIEIMIENRNWGQPEKMVDVGKTTWYSE